MNLAFFLARRLAQSGRAGYSRVIIRIATAAVALSISVMVASTALIAGFKTEISRKIFEFWGHIHISDVAYSLSFEPSPISRNQEFYPILDTLTGITYEEPETVMGRETGRDVERRSRGGIKHIQVFGYKPGIARSKTGMEGILLKGVGRDFDRANLQPYLLEGRMIEFSDSQPSRDLILSRQTADRLQVGVGDKIVLHFVKQGDQLRRLFEVAGIYKTGLEEYDRKFAICDLRQVQQLLDWDSTQVAGFEIWLDDLRDLDLYNDFIYQELLPNNLLSVSIRDKFPAIFEWLELQDYNEVVIIGLMLVVAIINMVTALLVLVLERSSMIGILKAVGATNRPIRAVFLYYAAFITLNGMFWGNLLGLGFCWLQDRFHLITLNEADYYLSYAPVSVNWAAVLGVNIGTLVVTLLFLILPSMAVSRVSPVRVIQFK